MYATRVSWFVRAPRAAVYRALLDPDAVARWRVPDGMTGTVHEFDARPGGRFRVSLTYDDPGRDGKTRGRTDTYHGHFAELVPGEKVVEVTEFETADPALAAPMTMTTLLADAPGGTTVTFLHEDVPDVIPPEDNAAGTRMALANLARLAESTADPGSAAMDAQPEPRGAGARLLDRAAGRLFGLPDATSDFTVTRNVRVPMRDGVTLAADLYRPDATRAAGTLLIRGPYGRGLPFSMSFARIFAARGYQALFVSSRGTFGSGGEFDPMRTEADDGQDVVAWLREQPWFAGTFATLGPSYLGFTQWALLTDPPAEMAAAISLVGPHDLAHRIWGTGAFALDFLSWSDMIVHQEDGGMAGRLRALRAQRLLRPVFDGLPLADAADAHLGGRAPWFRYRATHPDIGEPYWAPMRFGAALDRAQIPILLIGGWQDLFLLQTMEQYERLSARGVDVAMTVGPWQHVEVMGKGAPIVARETLDWLDANLAHRAPRRRAMPVRIFVTGAGEWRDLPSWPPATVPYALYTGPRGVLNPTAPPGGRDTFTYDPADPTPTVGGPLLSGGGIVDDRSLAARPDVLSYTSGPLERDLEVLGTPRVELAHRTDNPHADLFVRLSEVDARGRSHNVTETYIRLDPERGAEPVILGLRPTAHRFRAGNRIRLIIAGGSHPHYARNLGTDDNPGTGTTMRPSHHTVAHGTSRVLLPGTE